MKKCEHCNFMNDDQATRCENCGEPLTHPLLALICPNCGKVCALGTDSCPVCHHKLADVRPQKTAQLHVARSSRKTKVLTIVGIMMGLVSLFLITYFIINTFSWFQERNIYYEGMVVKGYDRDHRQRFEAVYVVQGKNPGEKKQFRLNVAYLGTRPKLLKDCRTATLKRLYQHHHHYHLKIYDHFSVLTGPDKVIIHKASRYDKTGVGYPIGPISAKVAKHPAIVKVTVRRYMDSNST